MFLRIDAGIPDNLVQLVQWLQQAMNSVANFRQGVRVKMNRAVDMPCSKVRAVTSIHNRDIFKSGQVFGAYQQGRRGSQQTTK
ncbi:MAG: hypothetical protein BWX80_03876 [Candidatus Hydrogenedentes bacterium ADurb.Bin101]|nr:MAG: hypothetical protein BWX80_03876 [Candidatus Hydrogenedentes bacterium ADurb.Bin101]